MTQLPDATKRAAFEHRSYYMNFGSHLLNNWNVNMFFPDGPNRWTRQEWAGLLDMVKAFGFTCFEWWLEPTMNDPKVLTGQKDVSRFVAAMQTVNELAHERGLMTKYIMAPNCLGHEWYFACPNESDDLLMIEQLWRYWSRALKGTDIVGIFPGDPGGCNRNGCDHNTFIDLALRLTEVTLEENPKAILEIGTWGTPFSGWGDDMRQVPNWDGSWKQLIEGQEGMIIGACHIWNGTASRARAAMNDFITRLSAFPQDSLVAINLGFSPDADAVMGGDAREYAREVSKQRRITSWDYSAVEGELIVHPHWRIPRIFSRRREERMAAPYYGAMSYTMSPKLSHLSMYAAAQAAMNPDRDPDLVSREFCHRVFGSEHGKLGELFEAFEVVPGWGHYPRRKWSKEEAHRAYLEIIEHLVAADMSRCELPLFPSPQQYHQDMLWFAKMFARLTEPDADRKAIRKEYWNRCLSIYDSVPMSADERAEQAARQFSQIMA
jgi:hypothetical protein